MFNADDVARGDSPQLLALTGLIRELLARLPASEAAALADSIQQDLDVLPERELDQSAQARAGEAYRMALAWVRYSRIREAPARF